MKLMTILFAALFLTGTSAAFDPFDGDEKDKKKDKEMVLNVSGMVCGVCEGNVTKELKELKGVKEVKASHEENKVRILLSADHASDEQISEAVKKAGFEVVKDDEKKGKKKKKDS